VAVSWNWVLDGMLPVPARMGEGVVRRWSGAGELCWGVCCSGCADLQDARCNTPTSDGRGRAGASGGTRSDVDVGCARWRLRRRRNVSGRRRGGSLVRKVGRAREVMSISLMEGAVHEIWKVK
jgi:hypothetical protein